jgi:hypothetical protein
VSVRKSEWHVLTGIRTPTADINNVDDLIHEDRQSCYSKYCSQSRGRTDYVV